MEQILRTVHSYKLCPGGPTTNYYKNAYSESVYKDGSVWRHKKCDVVLDMGYVCTKCINIHESLSRSIRRRSNKESETSHHERFAVPTVSPRVATVVNRLREKSYGQKKQIERRDANLEKMKTELQKAYATIRELNEKKNVY